MFAPDQYQLLDFGEGRKLERFGGYVVDRPAPAAEGFARASPDLWATADAKFSRDDDGQWERQRECTAPLIIEHGPVKLRVLLTPFGHVGAFPEHAENWEWIGQAAPGKKVLNLFAYTGGATLAAAAAGAEVVHVDAAKSTVAWAGRNAELSGLAESPIRWIIEDARKFVARELRRGNRYDAVILDPPSYGHAPQGTVWKIDQHLAPLLADCARLTEGRRAFFLLTCHSPGYGPAELAAMLVHAGIAASVRDVDARPLGIVAADGRVLPSGASVRWRRPS